MVRLAPGHDTDNAEATADLFKDTVFRSHGMPSTVVSDRGPEFTNKFAAALCKALGTAHCRSTSYHPQSNGQTERMNRVLEDMLRHFVNPRQDDWDTLLPVLEFAINNSFQESIQGTPFFLIMVDVLGFLLMSGCLNQTLVLTSTWTILTRPCKRQGSALMLLCSGRRSMLISIGLSSLLRSVMRFCSVLSTFLCAL